MSDRRVTRRQVLRGTALGLGLPAVSAVLAACGRDHADELGLDRLGDAPAPEGPTLSFLAIQPHERAARQLASDFQVATGALVRVTIVPYDQIRSKAIVDVQSGAAKYDVFDYWYTTVGELAHQGVLTLTRASRRSTPARSPPPTPCASSPPSRRAPSKSPSRRRWPCSCRAGRR